METEERNLNASGDEKKEKRVPARKPYKKPSIKEYGDIAELTGSSGARVLTDIERSQGSVLGHAPVRFSTPTSTPTS